MQFYKGFKNNLVFFAILFLCAGQPVFAGSVVGWGSMAANSTELDSNDFVAIAAGYDYFLALKSDGSIGGWGYNEYGQATPPDGNDFTAITGGGHHSLALKSDGSIVGFGYNEYDQAAPPNGNDFMAIAAGRLHSLWL